MSIQPFDRGGECFRCHTDHPKKVFLLMPNPSYSFGSEPTLRTPPLPIENYVVCEKCLTPEEKLDLISPVMAAALFLMLEVHQGNTALLPIIEHLRAFFLYRRGVDSRNSQSPELITKLISLLPL